MSEVRVTICAVSRGSSDYYKAGVAPDFVAVCHFDGRDLENVVIVYRYPSFCFSLFNAAQSHSSIHVFHIFHEGMKLCGHF